MAYSTSPPTRFWCLEVVKALPYAIWRAPRGQKNLVYDRFFAQDKLWAAWGDNETWELHYYWYKDVNPGKPVMLVSEDQVHRFISAIKKALPNSPVYIPDEKDWPGLVADFAPYPWTEPSLIGPVTCNEELRSTKSGLAIDQTPLLDIHGVECNKTLSQMLDACANCLVNKKSQAKLAAKKASNEIESKSFVKLQQLLGLRSPADHEFETVDILPTDRRVPWIADPTPVFVAIDVEWHEHNKSAITEVGISVLDVEDLITIPPGHLGSNWRKRIRSRHMRVNEYKHLVNKQYVTGCPENFEFGKSEIYPLAAMSRVIASCFNRASGIDKSPQRGGLRQPSPVRRPLYVVGHDPGSDIQLFRQLGYNIMNLSNLSGTYDTAQMYKFLKQEPQPASLNKVLLELDIDGWYLHNAGNDARYTLEACIGLAVGHRQGKSFGPKPPPLSLSGLSLDPKPAQPAEEELLIEL